MAASVAGAMATLVAGWAGEKQQDEKIAKKVTEAITNMTNKES